MRGFPYAEDWGRTFGIVVGTALSGGDEEDLEGTRIRKSRPVYLCTGCSSSAGIPPRDPQYELLCLFLVCLQFHQMGISRQPPLLRSIATSLSIFFPITVAPSMITNDLDFRGSP